MESNTNLLQNPLEINKKAYFSRKQIILIIFIILISLITTFFSGFFLHNLLVSEIPEPPLTSEPDNGIALTEVNPETDFLPGKLYFDDTVILVSIDEPHYTVVASASRTQKETDYLQSTRVSYFDGNNWTRHLTTSTNPNSGIYNNIIIKNWNINVDPSRILKQNVRGNLKVDNTTLSFNTNTLENEITIRSLPGYTKFLSEGKGKLNINGSDYESYVLYTRIYSSDASQLIAYDGSFGLITDWIAFWDQKGNFYHLDKTQVDVVLPNYQNHSIGILKNSDGGVFKTFTLNIKRDQNNPPQTYTISIDSPINKMLRLERYNSINKSPNNSYSWYMGNIKGNVVDSDGETVPGNGIVEYISKQSSN